MGKSTKVREMMYPILVLNRRFRFEKKKSKRPSKKMAHVIKPRANLKNRSNAIQLTTGRTVKRMRYHNWGTIDHIRIKKTR